MATKKTEETKVKKNAKAAAPAPEKEATVEPEINGYEATHDFDDDDEDEAISQAFGDDTEYTDAVDDDEFDVKTPGTSSAEIVRDIPKASIAAAFAEYGSAEDMPEETRKHIVSITGRLEAMTPEKQNMEDLSSLRASKIYKQYLTGSVKGYVVRNINGTQTPFAIVRYGNFDVRIPIHCFGDIIYSKRPKDMTKLAFETRLLRYYIGAIVDFVVTAVRPMKDTDSYYIVGNRAAALKSKRNLRYFGMNEKCEIIAKPYLTVGSLAEARVVSIHRNFIRAEVHGVITTIPAKSLLYGYALDLYANFTVGKNIVVKILEIKGNPNADDVEIVVSRVAAMPDPRIKAMQKYRTGDTVMGTVSGMSQHGVYVTIEEGVDILCNHVMPAYRPTLGSRVAVRVAHKDDTNLRMQGSLSRNVDFTGVRI